SIPGPTSAASGRRPTALYDAVRARRAPAPGGAGACRKELGTWPSSPDDLSHGLNQLILIRKCPGLSLRVERLAAHGQLEAAPLRGNHHEATDLALEVRQELGRQTDGLRLVVSKRAVFEDYFHLGLLLIVGQASA